MPEEISRERKSNLGKGKLRVVKDREYPPFEDKEWYIGKFVEHSEFLGRFGPCFRLNFKILRGEMAHGTDAKGQKCSAMVTAELTPKSKLMNFVSVFSGKEFDIDDVVDLKAYYGTIVKIFIEKGKSKNDNGKPYQNVTSIKEYKKKEE